MSNELKLSLENFQSISRGELIFHTGTTVIIGQSNSGKSATFRALKACLINPVGSQRFIKKGTKSSSVALEYNGNQIIWKRTPSENSYIINGETFLKTGRSNAFKLVDDVGFVTDYNDTIMNIEEELQLPFPFGINSIDLFKLYEDVFCVSDSSVIMKAAKSSEDNTKSDIVTLENEIIKNENKFKELQEFKEFVDIDKLKYFKKCLENKNDRINFLKEGLPIIKKAILVRDFKINVSDYPNRFESYKDKVKLQKELVKLKKLHVVGKSLKDIVIPEVTGLDKYKKLLDLLKVKETIKDLAGLKVDVMDFEDKIQRYKELQSYLSSLNNIKKKIKSKNEELKKAQECIKDTENALEEYKKEFKVCPLCHQPLK